MSVRVFLDCSECDSSIEVDEAEEIICDNCDKKNQQDFIKGCLKWVANEENHTWWTDRDTVCGFNTEEEKTLFLKGVQRGYDLALREACSSFFLSECSPFDRDEQEFEKFWEKIEEELK